MSKQNELAIDFAVLIYRMNNNSFPNFDELYPDMSDMPEYDNPDWATTYGQRHLALIQKEIENHSLGQHLLKKGYSWNEIFKFVVDVQSRSFRGELKTIFPEI